MHLPEQRTLLGGDGGGHDYAPVVVALHNGMAYLLHRNAPVMLVFCTRCQSSRGHVVDVAVTVDAGVVAEDVKAAGILYRQFRSYG